jgi:hypothetical protein
MTGTKISQLYSAYKLHAYCPADVQQAAKGAAQNPAVRHSNSPTTRTKSTRTPPSEKPCLATHLHDGQMRKPPRVPGCVGATGKAAQQTDPCVEQPTVRPKSTTVDDQWLVAHALMDLESKRGNRQKCALENEPQPLVPQARRLTLLWAGARRTLIAFGHRAPHMSRRHSRANPRQPHVGAATSPAAAGPPHTHAIRFLLPSPRKTPAPSGAPHGACAAWGAAPSLHADSSSRLVAPCAGVVLHAG